MGAHNIVLLFIYVKVSRVLRPPLYLDIMCGISFKYKTRLGVDKVKPKAWFMYFL